MVCLHTCAFTWNRLCFYILIKLGNHEIGCAFTYFIKLGNHEIGCNHEILTYFIKLGNHEIGCASTYFIKLGTFSWNR